MKQLHTGIAQASALHPFGEAETGRRAGERHKKPWHASTPPARSTARRAALPGAGGRQRPHPGRASSGVLVPHKENPMQTTEEPIATDQQAAQWLAALTEQLAAEANAPHHPSAEALRLSWQ